MENFNDDAKRFLKPYLSGRAPQDRSYEAPQAGATKVERQAEEIFDKSMRRGRKTQKRRVKLFTAGGAVGLVGLGLYLANVALDNGMQINVSIGIFSLAMLAIGGGMLGRLAGRAATVQRSSKK